MTFEQKEQVKDYLINNRDHLKELVKGFIEQREELPQARPELKRDIEDQFKWAVEHVIAKDISLNLGLDSLTILAILSLVNLLDYFNKDVIEIGGSND